MTNPSSTKPSSKKLTEDDVYFIRSLHKVQGLSSGQISRHLNIPGTTVRDVLARRTWSNLPTGLLSWTGEHPRHPDAGTGDRGCGQLYPEDDTKWCHRGAKHIGSHIWREPWRTGAESVAWLALEMRSLIDEVQPPEGTARVPYQMEAASEEAASPSNR